MALDYTALKAEIQADADDNFHGDASSTATSYHPARYRTFSLDGRLGSVLEGSIQRGYLDQATASLLIYFIYLGVLTLAPFDFSIAHPAGRTLVWWNRLITDVALNVAGFVPFGIIFYFLTQPDAKYLLPKWGLTTGAAAFVTLVIEIGQVFPPTRVPSPVDLLASMFGGGFGFWVAHYLRQKPWSAHLKRYRRKLVLSSLVLYLAILISFFLWAVTPQRLEGWEQRYPLLVGNETTLDRPWRGKIFFLALYNRVLTAEEILAQFQVGPNLEPKVYLKGAPIALYPFQKADGACVYDGSPIVPPLDLEIGDSQIAMWLPKCGLELTGPSLLKSRERPEAVCQHEGDAPQAVSDVLLQGALLIAQDHPTLGTMRIPRMRVLRHFVDDPLLGLGQAGPHVLILWPPASGRRLPPAFQLAWGSCQRGARGPPLGSAPGVVACRRWPPPIGQLWPCNWRPKCYPTVIVPWTPITDG